MRSITHTSHRWVASATIRITTASPRPIPAVRSSWCGASTGRSLISALFTAAGTFGVPAAFVLTELQIPTSKLQTSSSKLQIPNAKGDSVRAAPQASRWAAEQPIRARIHFNHLDLDQRVFGISAGRHGNRANRHGIYANDTDFQLTSGRSGSKLPGVTVSSAHAYGPRRHST